MKIWNLFWFMQYTMYHRPLCVIWLISGGFKPSEKNTYFIALYGKFQWTPPGPQTKKKNRGTLGPRCHYIPKAIAFVTHPKVDQVDSLHRDATIRHTPSVSLARVRSLNNSVMVTCGWDGKPKLGGFHWCNFGAANGKICGDVCHVFSPWQSIHGNRLGLDGLYIYNIL